MKKINEIFYSIQGEGFYAGHAAAFVRFSTCNLRCPFCDEHHMDGKMMSDEEIISELDRICLSKHVVLTGGEPSLFIDETFIDKLQNSGYYVSIETNGTHELPSNIDFVTCSPKFEFCKNADVVLKNCSELKVVYDGKNDMSKYLYIKADHYYIQPCDTGNDMKNREINAKVVQFVKQNPSWSISLQTHKILNVR